MNMIPTFILSMGGRVQPGYGHMPIDPDDLPLKKKVTEIVLGQDLSALSEFELGARIMEMETEIARCREAIAARKATKDAASAFFKS